MSHNRYANSVDANQAKIVADLRKIPGVSIEIDHDDIIVGFRGCTYWFEIKDPESTLTKKGKVRKGKILDSQKRIMEQFTGHYAIVWSLEDILDEMGIKKNPNKLCGHCWLESEDGDPRCKCE